MIFSVILNSTNPNIADNVIYAELAAEVWFDLKERFSQNNTPRIFQIQRDIKSHFQVTISVTAYYTKPKAFWDEPASYSNIPTCYCGAIKNLGICDQIKKVIQFLMGLNESYSNCLWSKSSYAASSHC